ncbi:DUF2087 domain-containing protein [Ruminococcaceae bacterium OttesenSCG-928-I18]|nr:DUF2087 domain-containing protein [Ruminococcaceae bacterium OttesenSCG-928-I18]
METKTIRDLCRGYARQGEGYRCLLCGETFQKGEVYAIEGRFYTARRAAENHVVQTHGSAARRLIEDDTKYNTLTENQKQLLRLFAHGKTDKETAGELGLSPSTVRHQKFMFREKAKQARLYLAQYESVFFAAPVQSGEEIMPIHDHARYVDERYVVTKEEREQILGSVFSSLDPLRLKSFPRKDKKKVVILAELARQFTPGVKYTEPQVNDILSPIFEDYVTLRRYLIDYGYLRRTRDGKSYWLA